MQIFEFLKCIADLICEDNNVLNIG